MSAITLPGMRRGSCRNRVVTGISAASAFRQSPPGRSATGVRCFLVEGGVVEFG